MVYYTKNTLLETDLIKKKYYYDNKLDIKLFRTKLKSYESPFFFGYGIVSPLPCLALTASFHEKIFKKWRLFKGNFKTI